MREVRQCGLADLSVDDVVEMGIHNINKPKMVQAAQSQGGEDIDVEQLIELALES